MVIWPSTLKYVFCLVDLGQDPDFRCRYANEIYFELSVSQPFSILRLIRMPVTMRSLVKAYLVAKRGNQSDTLFHLRTWTLSIDKNWLKRRSSEEGALHSNHLRLCVELCSQTLLPRIYILSAHCVIHQEQCIGDHDHCCILLQVGLGMKKSRESTATHRKKFKQRFLPLNQPEKPMSSFTMKASSSSTLPNNCFTPCWGTHPSFRALFPRMRQLQTLWEWLTRKGNTT